MAIIFYFPFAMRPYYITTSLLQTMLKSNSKIGGIGGLAYTEYELKKISINNLNAPDIVIPEPEEFSAPRPFLYSIYKIQKGDIISRLAENFGLDQGTLISINSIKNSRAIVPNQLLKIPNQDGIIYSLKKDETLEQIAKKYNISTESIITANELFDNHVNAGTKLFIPGAKLDYAQLQEVNGSLFLWPVRGRITSGYGYRISPINGARTFHTGIDVSAPLGTPIRAAMSGHVITAGYSEVFGNYVVITHHSNYRTLYGHMNSITAKSGIYVKAGDIIGYVGSTGQSTGSHLHFTVYKNGRTINPRLFMN